jgi:hypothetical protein
MSKSASRSARWAKEKKMPIEEEPVVGAVYEDEEGHSFEVTAFDEDEGTVRVRYDDDSVDEIDLDAWYELEIKRIADPEGDEDEDDDDDVDFDDEDEDDDDDDEDDFDDDEES